MCSLANPLTFRVQSKSIHTLLLVCLYIMLCSIALTSHFPLGSNALCAVKLTLDMSLSVDEDRYYVPLRLYVSPRPLLKHMEEKAHGWREHDDGTCHPSLGSLHGIITLRLVFFIRSVRSETGVCSNTSQNQEMFDLSSEQIQRILPANCNNSLHLSSIAWYFLLFYNPEQFAQQLLCTIEMFI